VSTVVDRLKAARAKLLPRGAWTQDAFARDRDGNHVDSGAPNAVCWCAVGALRAVGDDDGTGRFALERELLGRRRINTEVTWFNDYAAKSKRIVIRLFDRAIARAEAEAEAAQ